MIYLDYAATSPVNKEVLDSFNKVCLNFVGNPNSIHKLGLEAKDLLDKATTQIANILNVNEKEIIYTSGASESNNLAIKGILMKYPNRGKKIITTKAEHSSIIEVMNYLEKSGFEVSYVKLDKNGMVDLEDLKKLMTNDTVLVSIHAVNSEVGTIQDIKAINKVLKDFPKCFFHVDATQAMGKINLDFSLFDLASFSAHKFFGLKGIGVLYKREKLELEPLIHGGKSTTIYRSGTPALPLIVSTAKALRLAMNDLDDNLKYVQSLNNRLCLGLQNIKYLSFNSNKYSSPYIINISIGKVKPETLIHALEEKKVYISTKTACSKNSDDSKTLLAMGKSHEEASHSIRISLSKLTTSKEIDEFLTIFKKAYNDLQMEDV